MKRHAVYYSDAAEDGAAFPKALKLLERYYDKKAAHTAAKRFRQKTGLFTITVSDLSGATFKDDLRESVELARAEARANGHA